MRIVFLCVVLLRVSRVSTETTGTAAAEAVSSLSPLIPVPQSSVYTACRQNGEVYYQRPDEYVYVDTTCRKLFCSSTCRDTWLPNFDDLQLKECARLRKFYQSCYDYYSANKDQPIPISTAENARSSSMEGMVPTPVLLALIGVFATLCTVAMLVLCVVIYRMRSPSPTRAPPAKAPPVPPPQARPAEQMPMLLPPTHRQLPPTPARQAPVELTLGGGDDDVFNSQTLPDVAVSGSGRYDEKRVYDSPHNSSRSRTKSTGLDDIV